ncbi:MAG: Mur ligase [Thermomicrobiales bacterium]|nr:Mur ligase [Thermomicrobiales bacterium]
MRLVEIRDLDGPNLFLPQPTIKLELVVESGDLQPDALAALAHRLEPLGITGEELPEDAEGLGALLADAVSALYERTGRADPTPRWTPLETPGHWALTWPWRRRAFSLGAAELAASVATGAVSDLHAEADRLADLLATDDPDDLPRMIRDSERRIPAISVTGTNGKTTTVRLIAHILRAAGLRPGWTTTAGVYINGERVLDGDYSGPSGARRVLADEDVDVAVLETARGGILLRGMAVESVDVAVFTNISPDHLGLHGIHTVEGLARVKAATLSIVRPEGWAVLNADDPLVRGAASATHAGRFWVTRNPGNPTVLADLADGGRALMVRDGVIIEARGACEQPLATLADAPFTFGGRSRPMVENALCAAAACRALGRSRAEIAAGLATFGRDARDNPGRNEVYAVRGGTVIVDYAHNPAGLRGLYELARTFCRDGGRLTGVIGSAGDRSDALIREIGQVTGEHCDRVLIKETRKYLRGRASNDEITALLNAGATAAGTPAYAVASGELEAVALAVSHMQPGDVVAVMAFEDAAAAREMLEREADGRRTSHVASHE